MKTLPQNLFYGLSACVALGSVATLLTLTAQYHPPGVKPHQREAYAAKIRAIHRFHETVNHADPSTTPRAIVQDASFDFGMVDPHTTLSHEFAVSNRGGKPLQLEVKRTSCKCTVGALQTPLLPPGETTTVTLTWNTGYQADHYEQTATLTTNDPLSESIELSVKGVIRAKLVAPETILFDKADLGQPTQARFVLYSQLWESFSVNEVACDLEDFQWYAEPIDTSDARLAGTEARSAWEARLLVTRLDDGKFTGNVSLFVQPDDASDGVRCKLTCQGKVRAPINFYSKDIHPSQGLDIGTLPSGKEHNFHLIVRAHGDQTRKIDVLDVKPDELRASLQPLPTAGSYRLNVTVPADCPMVMFNGNHKHGYVQVGDPNDKNFSNWFPLLGGVVALEN